MKSEISIEINRPIEQVFELTLSHVAEWSLIVVEDKVIEERNNGGEGTTFRVVTEERGQRMEFSGTVIRQTPPTFSASRLAGQRFDIDVEYRFDDLGGRTRLTQRSTVTGKGLIKLMFLIMGPFLNKANCNAGQNELESLKRFVESR